ncbi:hypothetical protein V5O48_014978 [Marasmius crinis-equi]|uniref:Uncharacterized protein n=1 Tax=Marasmius crinis-equi TaxID=585013 RepID=A0ABR3EVR9_9AGAR
MKGLKNWSEDASRMVQLLSECVPSFYERERYQKLLKGKRGYFPPVIKSLRLEFLEVKEDPEILKEWELKKRRDFSMRETCNTWDETRRREHRFALVNLREDRRLAYISINFCIPNFNHMIIVTKNRGKAEGIRLTPSDLKLEVPKTPRPLSDELIQLNRFDLEWDNIKHVFAQLLDIIATRQAKAKSPSLEAL